MQQKVLELRPIINRLGNGVIMIRIEPMIFNANPIYVSLTRPNLSAISPAPTINKPENNADKLTAIFIVPISLL